MSKKLDVLETVSNTVAGIAISFSMTLVVFPMIGIATSPKTAGIATAAYFVASTARSYGLRRLFRWLENTRDGR